MYCINTFYENKGDDNLNGAMAGVPFPNEQICFDLHLRYPAQSPPLPSIEDLGKGAPYKRKYLTFEEYRELYSADLEDIEKVRSFASANYFRVIEVNRLLRLITLSGNIEDINQAFNIRLLLYKDSEFVYMGCEEKIPVPKDLEGVADCVLGLDYRPIARTCIPSVGGRATLYFKNQASGDDGSREAACLKNSGEELKETAWFPNQLAGLYNFPPSGIATGKGQSIAILEFGGGFKKEVLDTYFEKYINVRTPEINAISVCGGRNNPGHSKNPLDIDSSADYEVYLDIEVIGSIAYDSKINVYFGSTWLPGYVDYAAFWKTLASAVHDEQNRNSIVSCSWGWTEDSVCDTGKYLINQAMHEAAALNITICAASADDGTRCLQSDGGRHVFFPASSPFALACGGTKIVTGGGHIQNECTWNESIIDQSTGGGYSRFFPRPYYQTGITGTDEKSRGIPDVAANAALSYRILTHHGDEPVCGGGTSASTPLWAALMALLNESLHSRIGFINPFLYEIQSKYPVFNDITEGNNSMPADEAYKLPATQGYNAKKSWDECTGFGSPNGIHLLNALKLY